MNKKQIKIRCQNGLIFEYFKRDVLDLHKVSDQFDFIESSKPDFIVFGPYGNDLPDQGPYTRIGYFCENIIPDMSICEWAFGMLPESYVPSKNYKYINWHGLDPQMFVKNWSENKIDEIISSKSKFCNFLYSNPVKYRELFFEKLSSYKKVDAPGLSMNN
ncbi:MAG: hypothetical protein EOO43_23785, partial [Flavobacterium sp.]